MDLRAGPAAAIAVALSSLSAANLAGAGETAPRPRLVVDAMEQDLGTFEEGTEAVATFVVRNAGDAELAILFATPS